MHASSGAVEVQVQTCLSVSECISVRTKHGEIFFSYRRATLHSAQCQPKPVLRHQEWSTRPGYPGEVAGTIRIDGTVETINIPKRTKEKREAAVLTRGEEEENHRRAVARTEQIGAAEGIRKTGRVCVCVCVWWGRRRGMKGKAQEPQ